MIVEFIDEHRDELGVEPICAALQMAPSTYYAAKRREVSPSPRARRDAVMSQVLLTLWTANRKVYGAHKLWRAARRAGHEVGRDQVARLMREMGIEVVERDIPREYLYLCDELFMCGTAAEVTPIRSVDGRRIGAGKAGPLTLKLQKAYFDLVHGATEDSRGWLDYV